MVEAINTITNDHAMMRELYLADMSLQRSQSTQQDSALCILSTSQGLEIPKWSHGSHKNICRHTNFNVTMIASSIAALAAALTMFRLTSATCHLQNHLKPGSCSEAVTEGLCVRQAEGKYHLFF